MLDSVVDIRDVMRDMKYAQLNSKIKMMTDSLYEELAGNGKGVLGFLRNDKGKAVCGICGNTHQVEQETYGETCVEESHQSCKACSLRLEFLYGYSSIIFEGIEWSYSYTEKDTDKSYQERKKETAIVADIYYRVNHGDIITADEDVYTDLLMERTSIMSESGAFN